MTVLDFLFDSFFQPVRWVLSKSELDGSIFIYSLTVISTKPSILSHQYFHLNFLEHHVKIGNCDANSVLACQLFPSISLSFRSLSTYKFSYHWFNYLSPVVHVHIPQAWPWWNLLIHSVCSTDFLTVWCFLIH